MNVVDVLIPLIVGSLLAARPQIFLKKVGSDEEMAKRRRRLRTIGYVLGVAALYFVIALAGKR